MLEGFYERYVTAFGELGTAPLPPEHILVLIDALIEGTTATIN
jgi:hypothetical protein